MKKCNGSKRIAEVLNLNKSSEFGKVMLDLSSLGLSEVPEAISDLNNLSWLDLRHNSLTEIPLHVSNLPKLEWLDLRRNKIEELPASIGGLRSLKSFNLRAKVGYDKLKDLPDCIGDLKDEGALYLGDNQLIALQEWFHLI